MNCYALFFLIFINLSSATLLPTTTQDTREQELQSKIREVFQEKKELKKKFERNFNILVSEESLDPEEYEVFFALKHVCIDNMLKHFDYNRLNEKFMGKIVMWDVVNEEMKKCMSQVAQVRAERELERNISISKKVQKLQQLLDKAHQSGKCLNIENAQNLIIEETSRDAMAAVGCKMRNSCSYLIHKNFKEYLSERIDDISMKFSNLIKSVQNKNNIEK